MIIKDGEGTIRHFVVPGKYKIMVDGKEVAAQDQNAPPVSDAADGKQYVPVAAKRQLALGLPPGRRVVVFGLTD